MTSISIGCILQRSGFPLLMKHIHACRFVYNHSLEQKIRAYEQEGRNLSCFDLNNRLPALKEEHPWLKAVTSQSLQSANKNLDNAVTRFFREKKGFPQFKSKKHPVQSFQIPQHYTVDFERHRIKLPKIGEIKTVCLSSSLHRGNEVCHSLCDFDREVVR